MRPAHYSAVAVLMTTVLCGCGTTRSARNTTDTTESDQSTPSSGNYDLRPSPGPPPPAPPAVGVSHVKQVGFWRNLTGKHGSSNSNGNSGSSLHHGQSQSWSSPSYETWSSRPAVGYQDYSDTTVPSGSTISPGGDATVLSDGTYGPGDGTAASAGDISLSDGYMSVPGDDTSTTDGYTSCPSPCTTYSNNYGSGSYGDSCGASSHCGGDRGFPGGLKRLFGHQSHGDCGHGHGCSHGDSSNAGRAFGFFGRFKRLFGHGDEVVTDDSPCGSFCGEAGYSVMAPYGSMSTPYEMGTSGEPVAPGTCSGCQGLSPQSILPEPIPDPIDSLPMQTPGRVPPGIPGTTSSLKIFDPVTAFPAAGHSTRDLQDPAWYDLAVWPGSRPAVTPVSNRTVLQPKFYDSAILIRPALKVNP